jgi:ribosomal protein S18 acetylase RimI-like enzyme
LSSVHLFHPASVEEAHALLAASAMPVDTRTQRRVRSDDYLSANFESGRRRPEWVWGVRRGDDPEPLGVIGAFVTADGHTLLDVFDVPGDPTAARLLVVQATADALAMPGDGEVCVFAPPGMTVEDDALAPLVGPLREAGWRLLVERRHYEFEPPPGLAADATTELRFERMSDPADPRLVDCHREVMRDTLDEHDRELIDRLGFDEACAESLSYLLSADPVDRIHLALDRDGEVVGMVSGFVHPNTRAVVAFVGVARDHRGHGYGRQLLAWQTQQLMAAGATTLIADTDNGNVPMARAFADVGWEQTETRIDLVHGG